MDKLLIIDDEADILRSFRRLFEGPETQVFTAGSGEEGLAMIPQLQPDLVIMDVRMAGIDGLETLRRLRTTDSRLPVIIMTAFGTTQKVIEAMKLGAFDYVPKPFEIPKLKDLVGAALRAGQEMRGVVSDRPLLETEDYEMGIVGKTPAMRNVFKLVGQVAASDATALITGESGTGKELVARAIYCNSRRAKQPFLPMNCAAIPEALLETELFGHEKGAFTGASQQRIGRFEQCNHGTIFLDEIGDMPLATQTKILRVLQSGTFERVGGNETVKVDVRVIAATNRPLEQAVAARTFREDLFYRLNVVRIPLPPLRERREDIPLLVDYFLRRFAKGTDRDPKAMVPEAKTLLESYHWPGNVRELENAIRRATVVATGDAILARDLPPEVTTSTGGVGVGGGPGGVAAGMVGGAAAAVVPAPVSGESGFAASGVGSGAAGPVAAGGGGVEGEGATGSGVPGAVAPVRGTGTDPDIAAVAQALFRWARERSDLKVLPAVERELVIEALRETRGNQVQAARILGITRATLRKRIDKFAIRREMNVC